MITKNTVKNYARHFELLCIGLMFLVLTVPIIVWFFGDRLMDSSYGVNLKTFSIAQRIALFLTDYVASALSLFALFLCIKIARIFQEGKAFTPATTSLLAQLRKVAFMTGSYNILWYICFDYFFTTRPLAFILFFTGANLLNYLFTFVFISMFATLIFKASELQQDQDLTV
jgi:hypothetical protein